MKTHIFLILSLILIFFGERCHKDETVELPDDVNLGESKVFLNGVEADYKPILGLRKFDGLMDYVFKNEDMGISNLFAFGWLPQQTGTFKLGTPDAPNGKTSRTGFSQFFAEDLFGYQYKLTDEKDGFLQIEYLDTVKMEVKGRFRVEFCRTSKNGNEDMGLPKHLLYQGVFFEKYTRY